MVSNILKHPEMLFLWLNDLTLTDATDAKAILRQEKYDELSADLRKMLNVSRHWWGFAICCCDKCVIYVYIYICIYMILGGSPFSDTPVVSGQAIPRGWCMSHSSGFNTISTWPISAFRMVGWCWISIPRLTFSDSGLPIWERENRDGDVKSNAKRNAAHLCFPASARPSGKAGQLPAIFRYFPPLFYCILLSFIVVWPVYCCLVLQWSKEV